MKGNRTGGANVWSVMACKRLGDNAIANSVVALRASTGESVWGYQTVRHDVCDYDLAAQPLLFEHTDPDGTTRPAVAQAAKTGFIFVLDRETGASLHPVEERAVPRTDVPGEAAAPTQPFPKLRLHDTDARPWRLGEFTPEHNAGCERAFVRRALRGYVHTVGTRRHLALRRQRRGTNWGSMAYDRGHAGPTSCSTVGPR